MDTPRTASASTPTTSTLLHLGPEDLKEIIARIVRAELTELLESLKGLEERFHDDRLLTRNEAAEYLNVTTVTLRKYVRQGRLRASYFGRRVLFRQADLDAALSGTIAAK